MKILTTYEITEGLNTYVVTEFTKDGHTCCSTQKILKPTITVTPVPDKPPLPDLSTPNKKLDFIINELNLKFKYNLPP